MAKKKEKKIKLALIGGEKYEITGENGRYWVCGDKQFRKANVVVEEVKPEIEEDTTE